MINKFLCFDPNSKDNFLILETSRSTFLTKKLTPLTFFNSLIKESFKLCNLSFESASNCFFNFKFSFFNSARESTGFLVLLSDFLISAS